jgi:hypothetical protein
MSTTATLLKLARALTNTPVLIGKGQAIHAARMACEERGWGWGEPIGVYEGVRAYTIRTSTHTRGGEKAWFKIDVTTGKVRKMGHVSR